MIAALRAVTLGLSARQAALVVAIGLFSIILAALAACAMRWFNKERKRH